MSTPLKRVIGAQALGLLQLRFKRAPIPDARVAQGRRVFCQGRRPASGVAETAKSSFFDGGARQPIGLPRAGDAAPRYGLFERDLVGADIEMLNSGLGP